MENGLVLQDAPSKYFCISSVKFFLDNKTPPPKGVRRGVGGFLYEIEIILFQSYFLIIVYHSFRQIAIGF